MSFTSRAVGGVSVYSWILSNRDASLFGAQRLPPLLPASCEGRAEGMIERSTTDLLPQVSPYSWSYLTIFSHLGSITVSVAGPLVCARRSLHDDLCIL